MPDAQVFKTLDGIDRGAWNALFPAEPESYDYLRAVEAAGLDGFEWRYVVVQDDGRLLAAAPAFVTQYELATTLDGAGRRWAQAIGRLLPGLTTLRLACLGSPCTETAQIGFAPELGGLERQALAEQLLARFEQAALEDRCHLTGVKDRSAALAPECEAALLAAGYASSPSLPTANLAITFDSLDAYLAGLSPGTRRDMRRKLRARAGVRIEMRQDISGLEPQIMALYAETRARGDLQFETLTADYFTGVLERMGDRAICVLYFVEDELLAANLVLLGQDVLLDKFFCMNAELGRRHNLYFLSWFTNVALCLEHRLGRYQSGQAAYFNKLRLGSTLTPTFLHFRHRNRVLNQILRWLAPLLSPSTGQEAPP